MKEIMTYQEIQKIGGFIYLKQKGYEWYELYHKLPNGDFESHNLFEIYSIKNT